MYIYADYYTKLQVHCIMTHDPLRPSQHTFWSVIGIEIFKRNILFPYHTHIVSVLNSNSNVESRPRDISIWSVQTKPAKFTKEREKKHWHTRVTQSIVHCTELLQPYSWEWALSPWKVLVQFRVSNTNIGWVIHT